MRAPTRCRSTAQPSRGQELLDELAARLGAQCVVLAIDSNRIRGDSPRGRADEPGDGSPVGRWVAHVRGGRTETDSDVVSWAREGVERGAGEILLTSMDRDGTSDGYDLELTRAVASAVGVPVIASGGAGNLDHLVDALAAGADAALCASIFHFGQYTIAQAKAHLAQAGFAVRV